MQPRAERARVDVRSRACRGPSTRRPSTRSSGRPSGATRGARRSRAYACRRSDPSSARNRRTTSGGGMVPATSTQRRRSQVASSAGGVGATPRFLPVARRRTSTSAGVIRGAAGAAARGRRARRRARADRGPRRRAAIAGADEPDDGHGDRDGHARRTARLRARRDSADIVTHRGFERRPERNGRARCPARKLS